MYINIYNINNYDTLKNKKGGAFENRVRPSLHSGTES